MVAMGRWAFAFLLLMGVAELAAARVPNIDARGEASSGGRDLLHSRRLVMKKANEVNKDLIIAASEGNAKAIKKAIAGGADIESKHGDQEDTALTIAAHAGHLAAVKALIDAGANVSAADTEGTTALFAAAQEGHVKVVDALLKAGAEVNAQRSADGGTALIIASQGGHLPVVQSLIASGADVDLAADGGATALTLAVAGPHVKVVAALLEAGADPNLGNDIGAVPLHVAASFVGAGEAMASQLIASGANVDAATATGLTPLMVAARVGNGPVAMVLREAGADVGAEMEGGVKATDQICGCLEDGEGESACLEGVCGEASKKETVEKFMEILA